MPQTVLVGIQSPLALRSDVLLVGCGISLVMLSGARVALSPTLHRGAAAKAGGGGLVALAFLIVAVQLILI